MDRSFLSRPEVIAASEAFVCVRLTSYENADEMAFLKDMYVGRSGEVENTTFTILSPDGKRELVRTGRSTRRLFSDAADIASRMKKIAATFKASDGGDAPLPTFSNPKLALNVASADNLPLVIL